ncbi:hypothetical protein CRUP_019611 [Coryphaenoides rupestris]|nr:hypothetical protein CRUP_019611 [Coryphaenoides rupestris]
MADCPPEKSRGMKFAEQQLLRHGWTAGKGLGRDENGISEAIKVKVKCNKEGIGHKKGEEFTFHWWDHIFNKASSSLQVESDQNGVAMKTSAVDADGRKVSNKKPRKAALCKDKMYGSFVKAGTLLLGEEQAGPPISNPSSSSSEEDDSLDLSSTTRGARHGFNMSAKLARLEQQEAEFMAKYGKKNHVSNKQPENSTPVDQSAARSQEEISEVPQKKKKKKKKKKKRDEEEEDDVSTPQEERRDRGEEHKEEERVVEVAVATAEGSLKKRPSKKQKRKSCQEDKTTEEESPPEPKKKKKKKKRKEEEEETNMEEEEEEEERSVEDDRTQEEAQAAAPPKRKRRK